MPVPQATIEWLNIASSTIANWRPNFIDQVSDTNALINMARRFNAMPLGGGDQIHQPLMYAFNQNVDSYSRWDELKLTPQELFTLARYDWKDVYGTMPVAQDDILRNMGEQRQISYLDGLVANLRLSVNQKLNDMLWGDGTGNNSKDLEGLQSLVHVSSTNTVGGINAANNAYWRNVSYSYTTTGAAFYGAQQGGTLNTSSIRDQVFGLDNSDFDTLFLNSIDHVYDDLIFNESGPNIGICSMPVYRRIKRAERELKRYQVQDMTVDPGFTAVNFNGVPVTPDRQAPSLSVGSGTATGLFYWLNLDFMNLWIHESENFEFTEFYPLRPRQNAWAALFFLKANWAVGKRNAQGVLHSIIA